MYDYTSAVQFQKIKAKQKLHVQQNGAVILQWCEITEKEKQSSHHNRFNMMGTKPIQRKHKCGFANVINMFQPVVLSLWMMQKWK